MGHKISIHTYIHVCVWWSMAIRAVCWLTGYLARVMRCHLFSRFIANFPIRFFPTLLQRAYTHTHTGWERIKEIQQRFYLLHFLLQRASHTSLIASWRNVKWSVRRRDAQHVIALHPIPTTPHKRTAALFAFSARWQDIAWRVAYVCVCVLVFFYYFLILLLLFLFLFLSFFPGSLRLSLSVRLFPPVPACSRPLVVCLPA